VPSLEDLLPKKGYVVAGKYQIEGTLGTGGMGAVFEVSHRITGKRFAVKWLLPALTAESDAVMRFIREAQVAGRVDHPNVVEVYDVGQEGDSFYMVMELLQGEPLSDYLAREGKLTAAQACSILIPVMSGLSAAHAAGVIHRDLKPDNIYVCRGPHGEIQPKVLDFGISKMSNLAGEVTSGITRAGMVMGTPHYMAPEQVRAKPVDVRTDVYALGVILYEMLGGDLPFPGDTYSDLVLKIMTEAPKPLGQLAPRTPPNLIKLIERAMARDPDARFADVAELSRALSAFAAGGADASASASTGQAPALSPSGRNLPTPPRIQQTPLSTESKRLSTGDFAPPRKPISLIIGLAAVAAAVVGLGFWIMRIANQPVAPPAAVAAPSTAGVDKPLVPTPPPDAPIEKPGDNALVGGELPQPHTVRIGPDPTEPARAWQPPPGSNEAPRPMGADPTAAPQPEQPMQALDKPAKLDETPKSSRGSSSRGKHGSRADRGDKPNPPAPSSPSGSGNHRSLGLSMDDF
jgi:serine/threonine protein kinase